MAGTTGNLKPFEENQTGKRLVYLETLGCAKNRVDSEIMLGALAREGYGLTTSPEAAQVIIVNTCAFLTAASEESIERILELSDFKSSGQCEKLICAGCLSERYREGLLNEIPELDGLLGSSDFQEIPTLISNLYSGQESARVILNKKPHYTHYENQERIQTTPSPFVYVKVSEGCSNMCAFCNIPFLRGYFSSRQVDSIVQEIEGHLARGIREINLISQDTSSYGLDLKNGTRLADLLKAVDRIEGKFWVRLFYAYPNTFGPPEVEAMAGSSRILPYLDMPFQHISDNVLTSMNRRISEAEIRDKLELLKTTIPNLTLRTTFITGFPTEQESDFERLLGFVEEGWFEHVGVFTYSEEDNIPARKMGDPVPNRVKRERRKALLEAQQKIASEKNQGRIGSTLEVLVEGVHPETELLVKARAAFQGPEVDGVVMINEGKTTVGTFEKVEITEAHAYDLVGKVIQSGEI